MSVVNELVQDLGKVKVSAEQTTRAVSEGGNRMEQALRRTATQASSTANQLSMAQRSIMGLAQGFAAGLGFGSITMIGSQAVRYLQQMRAEAEKERKERIEGQSGFLSGTRAPEIMRQFPEIRTALEQSTPSVSDKDREAILDAYLRSGGPRTADGVRVAAAQSAAGPAMGITRPEMVALIGAAAGKGVSNPEDLAAFALNRSGGSVGASMQMISGMRRDRARHLASGNAGAFAQLVSEVPMTPADSEQLRAARIAGAASQIDRDQANRDITAQNQRDERGLTTEQRLELARAEGGGTERFTARQMRPLLDQYRRSKGLITLPLQFHAAAAAGDHPGYEDFPSFVQSRIQRVEIVPTTQPIGDDQP